MYASGTDLQAVFPAHAGVILIVDVPCEDTDGFPRTRGGDPGKMRISTDILQFSPAYAGVIPA